MSWIDWIIVFVPVVTVMYISWRTQRNMKSVSDFLAAGRVAGRYLVAVASAEAAMGLIGVVALFEKYYQSGFAIGFWAILASPIGLLVTLTGFAIYRYRETRVMTMAQFFELRYSRRFRIFAGLLAWGAGVINYALFPAVGARFLVHYGGLPDTIHVLGWAFPTFGLVMAVFLSLAVLIVTMGGQLTTMVTDCVAGLFSYFFYAAVVVAVLWVFSWQQMKEAMLDRPAGMSMFDPFDTGRIQQFNVFFVVIGIIGSVYNELSWQGAQAYNVSAASPHEQKMGRVLGRWRAGLSLLMVVLLAMAAFTYMHHPDFAEGAARVRAELASRIDLADEASTQTIRQQMMVPVAIADFLPIGVTGAFCAAMVFLLVSTDTTYLHSWGSILIQDVVLPLRKKPFTPPQQIWLLRLSITFVAVFAFFFSLHFNQVTYILMFFALTGALYLGGAGAVILGGLYWRRGTATGAWTAMLVGLTVAALGFFCQQYWAKLIYPVLHEHAPGTLANFKRGLESLGESLPLVQWEVTPDRFPISGQEVYFLTMVLASAGYIGVSLLTCREPFNLERMLHRGPCALPGEEATAPLARRRWWEAMLGFDEHFTFCDKVISSSVFAYSMFWVLLFAAVVLWNVLVSRFSKEVWATYFYVFHICLALVVGVVTSIWFTIGGVRDLRVLFQQIAVLDRNVLDDGRVTGYVNAEDLTFVPATEPDRSPAAAGRDAAPDDAPPAGVVAAPPRAS